MTAPLLAHHRPVHARVLPFTVFGICCWIAVFTTRAGEPVAVPVGITSSASGPFAQANATPETGTAQTSFEPETRLAGASLASGVQSPQPSAYFPGLLDDGQAYSPDIGAAVGPHHLMLALNSEVQIQNRQGQVLSKVGLDSFWSAVGDHSCYEPRVLFDPYGQRWLFTANANPGDTNAGLLIAVTESADPTGTWHRHFMPTTTPVDVYANVPTLGFNRHWVVLQANMFYRTTDDFHASHIYAFNKTNLYAGQNGQPLRFELIDTPTDSFGGSQVPAATYDPNISTLYLVQTAIGNSLDDGLGYLRVYSLQGPPPNPTLTTTFEGEPGPYIVGNPWEGGPPEGVDNFGPQLGTPQKVFTGDDRIQNVVFRDGTLWAVHTIFMPPNGPVDRAAVQWWKFRPGGWVFLEQGRIDAGPNDRFFAFPSIAVNRDLDILIGYTRFDAQHYPSAGYVFHAYGDVEETHRGDTIYKYGEAPYFAPNSSGLNAWGFYSATTVDPLNDTEFWTIQQYAAPAWDLGDRWGTWWTRVSPDVDLALAKLDSPDPVYAGMPLTYSIVVSNTLPYRAAGVVVTDLVPTNATFVSASVPGGVCTHSNGVVTCAVGTLEGREQQTVTVIIRPFTQGLFTTTATVTANGRDLNPANNSAQAVTTVQPAADLAVSITDAPDPVAIDQALTYTVTLTNRGPFASTGIFVTNTLPANVAFLSSSASQGACSRNGNLVTCNLGTINAAAGAAITISVRPTTSSTLNFQSRLAAATFDPDPANDAAFAVTTVNSLPTISAFNPQTINEDATLGPLVFTVADLESPADTLQVIATSTNPALVPDASILLGGSGGTRTLQLTPSLNQSGTATINLMVIDPDGGAAFRGFLLTVNAVNDLPTISPIANQTIDEDSATPAIPFVVDDVETAAASLFVSATAQNTTLIPNANLTLGGSGANRTVSLRPAANQSGTTTVTVTVFDGAVAANRSFTVTVREINDLPTISSLSNRVINEDTPTGPLAFTVADIETTAGNLVLSATSSNPTLVPVNRIVFAGSGGSRTVNVTPATNQFGTATLTLTVTDTNSGQASTSFTLTVNPINDAPTLNPIAARSVDEDAPAQSVPLADITSGAPNETQPLTVTAASANPTLIPNPTVTYTSPNPTGTLTFTPAPNAFGSAVITVTVADGDAVNGSTVRTFTVTVNPVNDPPTLNPLANLNLNEDAGLQTIGFNGVSSGAANESQTLAVSATSSDPAIVPHPTVTYISPNASGQLRFTPVANAFGTVTISVTVNDGGPVNATTTRSLTVTLNPINDPPTLAAIPNVVIDEDSGQHIVNLAGISSGAPNESQTLTVTASSSQPGLVPHPVLAYTSPNPTGTLRFTPAANQSGTATITVTIHDGAAANNTATSLFTVTVNPVNDPPTLNPIAAVGVDEDSGPRVIAFDGVSSGAPNETQTLVVTATSSDPAIIPHPVVTYASPNANGILTFTPAPNAYGTVTLTLTVNDGGPVNNLFSRPFVVTVNPINDPPYISSLANLAIDEDTPTPTLLLTVGDLETPAADLTLFPNSSNEELVTSDRIQFGGSASNRTLTIRPLTNQSGSATISILVFDAQGGFNLTEFVLTVRPVNDPPTLDPLADLTLDEDAGPQTVNLTGLSVGAPNETGALALTAQNSNPALLTALAVNYVSPNPAGTLTFRTATNAFGTADITVTASDGGASNNISQRILRVTVRSINDLPTVTPIANQIIDEDAATPLLTFTVGDVETAAANLTVTGASSNPALIPVSGILLGGTGANRTVRVQPAPDQFGTATVTLTVRDANAGETLRSFQVTVNPVNDPPVLTQLANQATDEDVPLALNLRVDDVETPPGALVLQATSSDAAVVPNSGLAFTGSGTNRTLTITPALNRHGLTTIQVSLRDNDNALATTSFTLTVRPVNDPPTLDPIADLGIDEDAGLQTVAFAGITSGAPDEVQSFTVTATTPTPQLLTDLAVTYASPAPGGTLTFRPVPNAHGPAAITVTVNDGAPTNNTFSRTFTVNIRSLNDLPAISSLTDQTTTEDSPVGPLAFTITDLETPAASLTLSGTSSNPALVDSSSFAFSGTAGNRTVTLTPKLNQGGRTTVTVTVTDADNGSASTRFEMLVLPINDPPTLSAIPNQNLTEDTVAGPLAFTVNDPESPAAAITLFATAANPTLLPASGILLGGAGANRTLTLTPAANQSGTTTVTLTAIDPEGIASNRQFQVTVNAINDPPRISGIASQTVLEDTATGPLTLLVDDPDTDAGALTVTAVSSNPALLPSANISISGTGPNRTVVLTPAANQFGNTLVTLTVADGAGGSATSEFPLTVTAVNDPPTLNPLPDRAILANAGLQTVSLSGISSGAPNEPQSLTVAATSSNPGIIPLPTVNYTPGSPTGTLSFSPVPGASGAAVLSVTIDDGGPVNNTVVRAFTVSVAAVSGPPVISAIPDQTTLEDTPLAVTFQVSDSETDPLQLGLVTFSSNPTLLPDANITVHGAGIDRVLVLQPAPEESGSAVVTLIASDGAEAAFASFTLAVVPVNDPPTLNPVNDIVRNEGFGLFSVGFIGVSAGAPNENQTTTVSASSSNPGLVVIDSVNYVPGASSGSVRLNRGATLATGTANITLTINDGGPANHIVSRTFTIYVKPAANTALPVISGLTARTIQEDTSTGAIPFTLSDSQTPADQITLTFESLNPTLVPPGNVTLGGSGTSRTLTVVPAPDQHGFVTIKVTAVDGAYGLRYANFNLTVAPVNDPPAIAPIPNVQTTSGTPTGLIPILLTDPETPAGQLGLNVTSSNPALLPNANILLGGSGTNRAVKLRPLAGQTGTATLTLTATDGFLTGTRTFQLDVRPPNEPPVISDLTDQTVSAGTATPPLPFTVGDPETPAASLTLSAASSAPTLLPVANILFGGSGAARTLTLTPAPGQVGSATVTLTVHDAAGGSASDTFVLTVQPLNHAPTLNSIANVALPQNAGPQTIPLSGITIGPGDVNQTLFIVATSSQPALVPHPALTYTSPGATGSLAFTPAPGAHGTAQITVTLNDGQLQNNTATRQFTVTINGAPTLDIAPWLVIQEDAQPTLIPVTVGDPETPAASLSLTVTSSNAELLPPANLTLGGTGANRTLSVSPVANAFGATYLSLVATDAQGLKTTNTCHLFISPVDDLPTLNPIADVIGYLDSPTLYLELTGISAGPGETSPALRLSATSDQPQFVQPLLAYISPNPTGQLTLPLAPNTPGSANITVTVDDGEYVSHPFSRTFNVTVLNTEQPLALAIQLADDQVVVEWPHPADGWILEQANGSLQPWTWTPVSVPATITGNRQSVSLPRTDTNQLFRLAKPLR